MQTIDKTKVDEIIDALLGNNDLTASPEVWYGLHKIKNLQPAHAIPVEWIEGQIERLNNTDNYFAKLTANIIKTMLSEWRKGEPNELFD